MVAMKATLAESQSAVGSRTLLRPNDSLFFWPPVRPCLLNFFIR